MMLVAYALAALVCLIVLPVLLVGAIGLAIETAGYIVLAGIVTAWAIREAIQTRRAQRWHRTIYRGAT